MMTTSHDQRIIHSSEESEWRTPRPLFDALNQEFTFAVDAAADQENKLCSEFFGPRHGNPALRDALIVDWAACSCDLYFFLNPPFSRKKARELKKAGDPHWRDYTVDAWAEKCWRESQRGCTIVAVLPFAPQTEWYRRYVYGHLPHQHPYVATSEYVRQTDGGWAGHAAMQERRLPHRISFARPDGSPADNAGVNSAIIVWSPATGIVGPWQPHSFYWSYR